ncbi:MAG: S-layer homology domain-containing protein [Firmicutes bacterium]|nr:S-layer homology domain-containing protein [Bacillota bacterium]
MKKTVSLFLTFALLLAAAIPAFAASGSMKNFEKKFTYEGQFEDVAANAWYAPYVAAAFEYGFVSGNSETTYDPDGNITLAETLVIADRIHSTYCGSEIESVSGGEWYETYVKYAEANGVIAPGAYPDYKARATRAQFAAILAKALPEAALEELADIAVIPDVPKSEAYAAPVYALYNAGILSGSDEYGTFHPASNIKRSEVAVIALNMADESRRKAPELKVEEVKLYSDYGSSMTVAKSEAPAFQALGWSLQPVTIPANASPETILNAATLNPMKTNDAELDAVIDRIFAQIIRPGMTTYQKVKACYDYLIQNAEYDYSGGALRVRSGYNSFNDAITVTEADYILTNNVGVCDDYSSAFMCMTRRIGLQSYTCACQAPNQSGGVSGHMVAFISVGGVNYIFDPQIEDYNAKGGKIPYRNFCKTFEAMAKTYTQADPAAAKAAFGGFVLR